ncbi:MAG TPA: YggT family protein [Burkholderiales bacterium]|nr:YggT family protein [Burkholderiales bacterium]
MSFFVQAGVLIVQVVFGLYILAVLLRFLFQLVRADFYNPISQFVVALTNPVLRPLRRVIPGLFGVDVASLLLLLLLKVGELYLVAALVGGTPTLPGAIVMSVADLIVLALHVFMVAIIVRAVISWFLPYGGYNNPIAGVLARLTDPLLRPAQRLIPTVGGLDLSPIAVLIVLQLAILLVGHLLLGIGRLGS